MEFSRPVDSRVSERIDGISASEKSERESSPSHPIPPHPRKKSGGGGEIDPRILRKRLFLRSLSFTVRLSLLPPPSASVDRDFQWRATSLPEIVLVTPREWRKRVEGLKGGTSGISSGVLAGATAP